MAARIWRRMCLAVGVGALSFVLVLLLGSQAPAGAAMPGVTGPEGQSFVYRFDPNTSSFVFTFTIPTSHANPWSVAVVSATGHLDVWFTESAVDRIGRLVYTNTHTFAFREYTLAAGSRPLNLVSGRGFIWFTGAGNNTIGRLNPATAHIDQFAVPTANSHPADLDIAADGSIWFTEMQADQIGRLVVDPTGGYTVTEYASPATAAGRGWPYGIVAMGSSVFFAHPRVITDCVTRFTPPASWLDITGLVSGIPNDPYELVAGPWGQVWGTERVGNAISSYEVGTLPIVNRYVMTPANSLPTSLALDTHNRLWFTQAQAGQIGYLVPSVPSQKGYFALPLPGLAPAGIAADSAGGLWVVASRPYRIRLPVVLKSW